MISLNKLLPETLPDTGSDTISFDTDASAATLVYPNLSSTPITIVANQSTNNQPTAGGYYVEDHSGFVIVDARHFSNVFEYELE